MDTTAVPPSSPLSRPLWRLALFGLSGVGAAYFGFVHFPVPTALQVLRHGGYYVMLLAFVTWLASLYAAGRGTPGRPGWPRWEWLTAGATITALAAIALTHETFRSKILYDEYVLQSTAYNMHFFRDNSAIVRGYEISGVFASLDSYVDKRPAFFPFLLALVHDLTGYRPANVYGLNAALFLATLAVAYALGRQLNGWRGGLLAVVLLGSLPLFAQNATGAGMELLNVGMLLVAVGLGAAWLREPTGARLSALVFGVILLVQSRYESALYVAPAALAILVGWWRAGRIVISWPVVVAPWLLVPVALQQKVISNSPLMWELHDNQTSRFSLDYLAGNLDAAWAFFTAGGLALANSPVLAALGAAASGLLLWRGLRAPRRLLRLDPLPLSLLLFGAGALAITILVMFYYWSALTDPMASRFALSLNVLLVFIVVVAARWGDARLPASIGSLGVAAIFALTVSSSKQAYHFYSHLGNDEIEWERRVITARPGTRLILANKSTLPWMLARTPAILLTRANAVADRLAEQLHQPDFNEILVTQSARPTTPMGDYEVVPDEQLPAWIHLELLAERRFGTKLARISRVAAIDLPKDFKPSSPPPVGSDAAPTLHPGT